MQNQKKKYSRKATTKVKGLNTEEVQIKMNQMQMVQ